MSDIFDDGLKRVLKEFAKIALAVDIPNYDKMYKIINEEIEKCDAPKPVLISWLSPEDRINAAIYSIPNIDTIKNPVKRLEFHYPKPKFDYFDRHQGSQHSGNQMKSSRRKSQNGPGSI